VFSNPTNPYCIVAVNSARDAAAALHVQLNVLEIAAEGELESAFQTLSRERADAILVVADPFLASQQIRIADFLVQQRLPSITPTASRF
jgi:hypothetical protein